jgi:RNA polymerase sigma-70 factor (ECF subfamily)
VTATADLEPLRGTAPSISVVQTQTSGLCQEELDRRWKIVLPHAERLRRIAARRLASPDEADDVVQEAMLRAVTFEQLDEGYAGQFLTSVTVRLCADMHRERDRQLRVGVRDAARVVAHTDPHEDVLDTAEARWLYRECLKLPGRERAVVLARARGLSVREAAGTLGVGVKSAEAALTKARHRMRRLVQAAGAVLVTFLAKARRFSTPAMVSTSMSVLFVGGVMHAIAPHDGAPIRVQEAPLQRVTEVAVDQSAETTRTNAAVARVAAPAGPDDSDEPDQQRSSGSQDVIVRQGPVGDPDVVGTHGPIIIDKSHEEESLAQTAERCLRSISLDPAQLVCPEAKLRAVVPGS